VEIPVGKTCVNCRFYACDEEDTFGQACVLFNTPLDNTHVAGIAEKCEVCQRVMEMIG